MMDMEEVKKKSDICLTEQLNEIELLESMYCKKDEMLFTDTSTLQEVRDFLDNKTNIYPRYIDFTIKLYLDKMKVEICINLPTFYPEEKPNVYISCNQLNRQQESSLNKDATIFIKENHVGEVSIYTVILWVQDNIENYKVQLDTQKAKSDKSKNTEKKMFARFWIISHHIYNKKKRDAIVKRAKELNITGFCLSGNPGYICIEGWESDCQEWWKIIRSLLWKRIVIKTIELFKPSEKSKEQRFFKFEEIRFYNHSNGRNWSQFSKYIQEHSLTYAFNDILKFGNKNVV